MKLHFERLIFNTFLLLFSLRLTVFIDNSIFNQIFGGLCIVLLVLFVQFKPIRMKIQAWTFTFLVLLIFVVSAITIVKFDYDLTLFFYDTLRYLAILALFLIGGLSPRYLSPHTVLAAFLLIISFHCVFAIFDIVSGDILKIGGQLRLAGFFEHSAKFGLFFGFASLVLFLLLKNRIGNSVMVFTIVVIVLGLLAYNNTLRIIFGVMASAAFYYIVIKKKIVYLIIIVTSAFFLVMLNQEVKERFVSIVESEINPSKLVYGEKLDNSLQWRLLQWRMLITDWHEKHKLTGAGIGQETKLEGIKKPDGEPFISHSDFVKILIETGVLGFVTFLFIVLGFYRFNIRVFKEQGIHDGLLLFFFFLICSILGSAMFTESFLAYIFALGYLSELKTTHGTPTEIS
jgi:O-antigen ligase